MAKIEMPSSSINSTGETPKKQLKKVTTGKVTIKQESEIQKLAHNFLAEDLQTIREKLWTDYILPGIKNMVCSAVNIALFGVDRSRTNTGGCSQQRNSYSSYYANANQSRPPQNNYRPNRLDWQNITFDSYADANDVLNEMGHALHEYGQVTIADFYDVVGITRDARDYQDCKYGWYDLGPASIKGVPGGYTIVFPKPVPLN